MSRSVYGGGGGGDWERERPRTVTKTVYKVPDNIARSSAVGGINEEKTEDKIVIRRTHREDEPWDSRDSRDDLNVRITERTRERSRQPADDDYRTTERTTYERDSYRDNQRDIPYRTSGQSNFTSGQSNFQRNDDWDDRRTTVSRYTGRDDNRRDDNYRSDYKTNYQSEYRVVDREREYTRAPSPPRENVREFRFERERDYSPERRREPQYDVERYSKETEYYSQPAPAPAPQPIIIDRSPPPQAPQPIIIREIERTRDPQPIIIREERRPEPQYEFIERKEVQEEKSLVRREEPPPPAVVSEHPQQQQQDESYFYERRVREIDRSRRRDESSDRRTEIRPRDSASNYSSDDSYEYVRRERTTYGDEREGHHRRHLAEGALAGAAGAAILRHHRKSEGKEAGGRLGSALAGAGVGALGAEAITRYRSKSRKRGSRSRSRSRSRSSDYDSRRDRRDRRRRRHSRSRSRDRSRSRSKSLSRKQQLAVGAGLAGVAALAGYALKNRNKGETVIVNEAGPPPRDRRSRSRRRRGSPDSYMMSDEPRALQEADEHRDPEHRNRRIAQAGLASAAAAGIYERYRSKSRGKSKGRGKSRSKSRVRTGVPIAAAGLGGAALAGLYEKNKASKEAKKDAVIQDELGRGRRRRSRSRSRSVPAPHPDDRRSVDHRGLVAYGDDPIYPDDRSREYYSDEEPGVFRRRGRGGSRSSYGSSPDTRKRSRSRGGKNFAAAAGAAGLGAVAGHEYSKRKERRKSEEAERLRQQDMAEDYRYDDRYRDSPDPYNQPPSGFLPPQQPNDSYAPQQSYPGGLHFQPPPTAPAGEPVYAPRNDAYGAAQPPLQQAPYPAYNPSTYNPADYAQPGAAAPNTPYDATRGAYGESDATLGAPYGGGETYAGDPRYPPAADSPRDERRRGGRTDPENVSAPKDVPAPTPTPGSVADDERSAHDAAGVEASTEGTRTPRARSSSRVRFDLGANTALSPEAPRRRKENSDTETSGGDQQGRRRKKKHHDRDRDSERSDRRRDDRDRDRRGSNDLMNDKYERAPRSTTDDGESEDTVDLPDRFDERGNPKKDDPLNDLISGLASRFLGGSQQNDDDDERESRRGRRHRH